MAEHSFTFQAAFSLVFSVKRKAAPVGHPGNPRPFRVLNYIGWSNFLRMAGHHSVDLGLEAFYERVRSRIYSANLP